MKVLIAGGKLQGVEAAYLAGKCGFDTVLVDKKENIPAKNLCTAFIQMDILNSSRLASILQDIDIVIPALENHNALIALSDACKNTNTAFPFSTYSYTLSSSKEKSKHLFENLNLPVPDSWPYCTFPVIVKPSFGSGSEGVKIFHTEKDLYKHFPDGWDEHNSVVEQYIEGKQYSLEVMGFKDTYVCLQVTELEIDGRFDCKRVIAPSNLSDGAVSTLEKIALSISRAINLHGIMDIEAIYHEGNFKVLEIDARLPSQTPIAVYWSTGFNIIGKLVSLLNGEEIKKPPAALKAVVLEHFKVEGDAMEICGEHIIAEAEDLHILSGFFGADEILSDYHPGKETWRGTLVVTGNSRGTALAKRTKVIEAIRKSFGINHYRETSPELPQTAVRSCGYNNG